MQKLNKLTIWWRTLKFKFERRFRKYIVNKHYSDDPMAFLALLQIEFLPVEYYVETNSWEEAIKFGEKVKAEIKEKEKEFTEAADKISCLSEMSKLFKLKNDMLKEANIHTVESLQNSFERTIGDKISGFTTAKLYGSVFEN